MKRIKFKLSIDPSNAGQVEALSALLLSIGVDKVACKLHKIDVGAEQEKPEVDLERSKEVKPKRATKPTPIVEDAPEATQDEPEEKPETKLEPKEMPGATISDIRSVLGQKVADHRDAIKNKLNGLGAKNVSILAEEHYDDFKTFLDSL